MISKKLLAMMAAVMFVFVSCEPEDDDDIIQQPTSTKAKLAFHFDHKFGNDAFALNQDFTLPNGVVVNLSFVKFYMSQIMLMDDTGGTNMIDDYFLIDESTHHMDVAELDPQHMHMLRFNIGIDSASNFLDPTTYPAGHPLAPQSPSMHWSWNSGYIFFKLEGSVDLDADGTVDTTFEYHIGLLPYLRSVQSMQHKDLEAGKELEVDIEFDYAMFFDSIDLSTELSAHGMDDPGLTAKIADNVNKAISID